MLSQYFTDMEKVDIYAIIGFIIFFAGVCLATALAVMQKKWAGF